MVFLHNLLFAHTRAHLRPHFIDSLRITVKGGHGGNGVPKYGGIGGQGGCVYFLANKNIDLRKIKNKNPLKRISAGHGESASKERILGKRGEDYCLEVPQGICVVDDQGKMIGELNEEGSKFLAAGGGVGGCSGTNFLGTPGQSRTLKLDLKLIADCGLVGFPNAGKSTLLKAISNASPKIASYPFTTIRPQIGMVGYEDYRQISIADLPGLIEGAHVNIGLGHKFLKHVERTKLLVLVVDVFGFQLRHNRIFRNCLENIYSLNKELELYDETLLQKPCILLLNKMDKDGSLDKLKEVETYLTDMKSGLNRCPEELRPSKFLEFEQIIPISARNIKEIEKVKNAIRDVLDVYAEKRLIEREEYDIYGKLNEKGPRIT